MHSSNAHAQPSSVARRLILTPCVRTEKALAGLRGCAVAPEPSLFAYAISTKISCVGSIHKYTCIVIYPANVCIYGNLH